MQNYGMSQANKFLIRSYSSRRVDKSAVRH